jgi:hypothetical protein
MTRTELIIQLLKVVIGLAFGAYFVWWSLEVLDLLTPDNNVPTASSGWRTMKTRAAFGQHEDRTPGTAADCVWLRPRGGRGVDIGWP